MNDNEPLPVELALPIKPGSFTDLVSKAIKRPKINVVIEGAEEDTPEPSPFEAFEASLFKD